MVETTERQLLAQRIAELIPGADPEAIGEPELEIAGGILAEIRALSHQAEGRADVDLIQRGRRAVAETQDTLADGRTFAVSAALLTEVLDALDSALLSRQAEGREFHQALRLLLNRAFIFGRNTPDYTYNEADEAFAKFYERLAPEVAALRSAPQKSVDGWVTSEKALPDGGREYVVVTRNPWPGDVPIRLFAPPADTAVEDGTWVCAKCGYGSQEHGTEGHPAYLCIYQPVLRPATPPGHTGEHPIPKTGEVE